MLQLIKKGGLSLSFISSEQNRSMKGGCYSIDVAGKKLHKGKEKHVDEGKA